MKVSELDGCTESELDRWDHVLEAAPALLAAAQKAVKYMREIRHSGDYFFADETIERELSAAIALAIGENP